MRDDRYPPQYDPTRQCAGSLQQLYEDAKEAHAKLRSLFASEWKVWKTVGGEVETVLHVPMEGKAVEWVDVVIDPGPSAQISFSSNRQHLS